MAEIRGQFLYNDDGSVAQLVSIAGATSNGTGVGVTTNDVLPYERQATLVNTAVTHTGVVIPNANGNIQSTWQLVPDGMSEFINNLTIDSSVANVYTNVEWSEDGTNRSGQTIASIAVAGASTSKTSLNWLAVGGAFYKVNVWNGDAAPRTCSANIKFRP